MEFKSEGNRLYAQGKTHEAVTAYTKGINLVEEGGDTTATPPKEGRDLGCLHILYSNRSMAHLDLCLPDEALQDAECAIEANPEYGKAYLRRAAVLLDLFNFQDALKDLDKAEELEPDSAPPGSELRQRAEGDRWVPNCYAKKQLDLQKMHKGCDYVIQIEVDGQDVVEAVKLGRGTDSVLTAQRMLGKALTRGKPTDGSCILGGIILGSKTAFNLVNDERELGRLLQAQLLRECSGSILSFRTPQVVKEKFPRVYLLSCVPSIHYAMDNGGICSAARDTPILLPGAPKWFSPEENKAKMLDYFLLCWYQNDDKEGDPPTLEEFAVATYNYIQYRENLMSSDREQRKCQGCQKTILDPDPPECLCGAQYCAAECHTAHWPQHKTLCNKRTTKRNLRLALELTSSYWIAVSTGWFPCKDDIDYVAKWAERNITKENHQDPLGAEFDFYLEQELYAIRVSITDVERPGTTHVMVALEHIQRYLTHFPHDSCPRIAFKLYMIDFLSMTVRLIASQVHGAPQGDLPFESVPERAQEFLEAGCVINSSPGSGTLRAFLQAVARKEITPNNVTLDWVNGRTLRLKQ